MPADAGAGDSRRLTQDWRHADVGEPRLLVENGIQAEVSVKSEKGNAYRISVRPQRT